MPETPLASGSSPRGNPGVPVGCALLGVCFFLPWVSVLGLSGMQVATDGDDAVGSARAGIRKCGDGHGGGRASRGPGMRPVRTDPAARAGDGLTFPAGHTV